MPPILQFEAIIEAKMQLINIIFDFYAFPRNLNKFKKNYGLLSEHFRLVIYPKKYMLFREPIKRIQKPKYLSIQIW